MADDGKGSSVRIPSFLIRYSDGERIKKYFEELSKNKTESLKNGSHDGHDRKGHQVIMQA